VTVTPLVIAIDGPAGSGKSTLARRLAERLGWAYLDSGAMYRAVTVCALERNVDPADGPAIAEIARKGDIRLEPRGGRIWIEGREVTDRIRTPAVNAGVSAVAAVAAVREVMVAHQRRFARQNGRIVAEGRDMATVVFPDAFLKVYLDASEEERARRRTEEIRAKDPGHAHDAVRASISRRDRMDRGREVAPLRAAEDAWVVDSTGLTPDEVLARVLSEVQSRVPPSAGP
jgi:cytidylate kinase